MAPAKKSLGQNFLRDPTTICKIIEFGRIQPGEPVLEIGPGRGALTSPLLKLTDDLIAIELDEDLIEASLAPLFEKFPRARLIRGDIRTFDPHQATGFGKRKVFGNLPYYLATHLILKFAEPQWRPFFSEMILMVQKEVAERIWAQPASRDYGYLSCICQLAYQLEKGFLVRPGAFSPRPKVDSAVIRLAVRDDRPANREQWPLLKEVLKLAFAQRRKTIQNSLKGSRFDIQLLRQAGIPPTVRPEELPVESYLLLVQAYQQQKSAGQQVAGQQVGRSTGQQVNRSKVKRPELEVKRSKDQKQVRAGD
ncbi:MAG TPA: 16S rRNA (adenine(1518)-N(6)/adenine(1519)-N(6))-dimethyltransferase RsmA [Acidobacteriota bacterium]|nr:16S rRNA (adenine(1518)-N(6)/adenine(1519)-N(6))-dimethyltransferase RsmA [Acidobacteriota bacterium]